MVVAVVLVVALAVTVVAGWQPGYGVQPAPPTSAEATMVPSAVSAPTAALTPTLAGVARPSVSPSPGLPLPLAEQLRQPLPTRDLADLIARLRPVFPPDAPPSKPTASAVGQDEPFWVTDADNRRFFLLNAALAYTSQHTRFYLQEGESVISSAWREAANAYETGTYPRLGPLLGAKPSDPPITVLNGRVPGVRGYFTSVDSYPRSVFPWSNERDMIYINSEAVKPGRRDYDATLAHEAAHLLHHRLRGPDDTWVSEGTGELAMRLAGFPTSGGDRAFRSQPDTQLTAWSDSSGDTLAHYGAAYLFLSYFLPRYGGYQALPELLATPGRGPTRFDAYLAAKGYNTSFNQVAADWAVANYINDPAAGDGRFAYADIDFRLNSSRVASVPTVDKGAVSQYAASYHEFAAQSSPYTVYFTGTANVRLLENEPRSGRYQWWSNRGDTADTRLTRELELSSASGLVTLEYWVWFDLERDYDYTFVEISRDGGQSWTTMEGRYTTSTNPLGANLGHGYTGISGGGRQPQWVRENIDLTPYVGGRIHLRFEMVTDDAYNAPGFALDDLQVEAIGYRDDAESDTGWQADGFLRVENSLPQDYAVRLIRYGQKIEVVDVPLNAARQGKQVVRPGPGTPEKSTLVVMPQAPVTTVRAEYQYSVAPGER